jgi:hypothetical protein
VSRPVASAARTCPKTAPGHRDLRGELLVGTADVVPEVKRGRSVPQFSPRAWATLRKMLANVRRPSRRRSSASDVASSSRMVRSSRAPIALSRRASTRSRMDRRRPLRCDHAARPPVGLHRAHAAWRSAGDALSTLALPALGLLALLLLVVLIIVLLT